MVWTRSEEQKKKAILLSQRPGMNLKGNRTQTKDYHSIKGNNPLGQNHPEQNSWRLDPFSKEKSVSGIGRCVMLWLASDGLAHAMSFILQTHCAMESSINDVTIFQGARAFKIGGENMCQNNGMCVLSENTHQESLKQPTELSILMVFEKMQKLKSKSLFWG